MKNGNETVSRNCRFLNESYFTRLYDAFMEAFSDYVVPFVLTADQFRNHINLNAVDLDLTVGCVAGDRLIGFSLNGFGLWKGRSTVYDAGTGVVPDWRRQGVSDGMFDLMLPAFKEKAIEQFLLEVVTTNSGAVRLYEKLDFRVVRVLALLQCDGRLEVTRETPPGVELRDIDEPDWELLATFWDGDPSWQNSIDAVNRSRKLKRMIGAYADGKCIGYIVFSSRFGRVAQIAVDKEFRKQGVGSALVMAMQSQTADGFSMQVINIDKSLTEAMRFFGNRGFRETLSQLEMIKQL